MIKRNLMANMLIVLGIMFLIMSMVVPLVPLTISRSPDKITVVVTVLFTNGLPVQGAKVTFDGDAMSPASLYTTAEGKAEYDIWSRYPVGSDIVPGTVRVEYKEYSSMKQVYGKENAVVSVAFNDVPVSGVPEPDHGRLEVYAYEDSEPVYADVEVEGWGSHSTPFDCDLEPGSYKVTAVWKDEPKTETANIEAGKTTKIHFYFGKTPEDPPEEPDPRYYTLRVSVKDHNGNPLVAQVDAMQGDSVIENGWTDNGGMIEFTLLEGEYIVKATFGDVSEEITVNLRSNVGKNIVLDLSEIGDDDIDNENEQNQDNREGLNLFAWLSGVQQYLSIIMLGVGATLLVVGAGLTVFTKMKKRR